MSTTVSVELGALSVLAAPPTAVFDTDGQIETTTATLSALIGWRLEGFYSHDCEFYSQPDDSFGPGCFEMDCSAVGKCFGVDGEEFARLLGCTAETIDCAQAELLTVLYAGTRD